MTDWTCATCGTLCAGTYCPVCVPWTPSPDFDSDAQAEKLLAYFQRWGTAGE